MAWILQGITQPQSLACIAMLKCTKVKLDLSWDKDMYLFFKKQLVGCFSNLNEALMGKK